MKIDLQRIKKTLPNRAKVNISKGKTGNGILEIIIIPELSESDFEECKNWQREIIGQRNISEFYTIEAGKHWLVYLDTELSINSCEN